MRNVIGRYIGGGWGKGQPEGEFREAAWVIRGTDIPSCRVGQYHSCPLRYHSESNLRSRRLVSGDLVMEVSGGSRDQLVGRPLLVTPGMLSHFGDAAIPASFCKLIRPDPARIDSAYLYYVITALYDSRELGRFQIQSTGISNFQFEAFLNEQLVSLPALPTQRKIAAILSAYDDLIENNNRRIKILEETAQRIYREWFVNFRYPEHQRVPLVESELGPIPLGWVVRRLGDVATVDKGLTYKGAFLTEQGLPMANLKCFLVGGGFRRDGTKSYSGGFKPRHSVVAGDLIVANTDLTQVGGVIGSPAIIPRRGFENGGLISHHLFAIRPTVGGLTTAVLFHMLADERFRQFARSRASGTTVLGFRTADCETYRLAVPTNDVLVRFGDIVDDVLSLSETLREFTEYARATRDLLLPRLISGEIDVEGLNIEIPEAAA